MAKKATRRIPGSKPPSSSIPPPFKSTPDALEPLLSCLSKDAVYIAHIDRHPTVFKKQIFTIPVLLNFGLFMGLFWRAYTILPWYLSVFIAFSQGPGVLENKFSSQMAVAIFRRLVTFAIDYVLVAIIAKWPYTFFFERPGNPVSWRLNCGFKESEAIIRISRGWGAEDLMGGTKKGAESPFFKTRLLPALSTEKLQKTGYLLMDGSWDLDFGVMVKVTKLLDKAELREEQLDRKVFAWTGDDKSGQWSWWDEKSFGQEMGDQIEEMEEESNTEHREKIFRIQEKLKDLGKEDLFFKWIELIQYESTQPGGFTPERQLEAGAKVQALFEEHGVDFEDFEKAIGGMQ